MEWYESEDRAMFADTAAKFAAWARENIDAEHMAGRAAPENFTWEIARQAGRAGFLHAPLPEDMGGAGLDALGRMVVIERMARGLAGPAAMLAAHWAGMSALVALMEHGPVRAWLGALGEAAESDRPGLCGVAVPAAVVDTGSTVSPEIVESERGLILHGEYICPVHPALTDRLIVPITAADGRREILGIDGAALASSCRETFPGSGLLELPMARLRFAGYDIDPQSVLAAGAIAEEAVSEMRRGLYLGLAAAMAGNAAAAAEYAWDYAGERVQTGRPIRAHQDVRRALEQMKTMAEAARAMVFTAAAATDGGGDRARRAFTFAGGACEAVCQDAVQSLGGYGYMKDYGLERRLRDAKTMQIMLGAHALEWAGEGQ
ncbi:MAG TPA: acyl-CoA dehydrogenase family protein [bacterium]|nr:acyl-CoA dehydrogenase family protein [bacterium]